MTRHRGAGDSADIREGESFLRRFSRRKQEARSEILDEQHGAGKSAAALQSKTPSANVPPELPEVDPPGDDDMPSLESLTADSDYSAFFSPKVSESLRRSALRRLWQIGDFGVADGLDIYAADYTRFEALGDLVTAEMKHRVELEMRRQAEALSELPENPEQPLVVDSPEKQETVGGVPSNEQSGPPQEDWEGEDSVEEDV